MTYVKVIWKDIAGVSSGDNSGAWLSKEEALEESQKLFDSEYITIGEIIQETKDFIVIAATKDLEGDLYSDVSMIPKSVVVRVEDMVG